MSLNKYQVSDFNKVYYNDLNDYENLNAQNESTVETAFKNLLISIGKLKNLTLIKETIRLKNGNNIIPDGIIKDEFNLTKGIWEAKDSKDNLENEIKKKIEKGYPLKNTIFEDTKNAVLYQNNEIKFKCNLQNNEKLIELLLLFFYYSEPQIEDFYEAIKTFEDNIPKLGKALFDKIESVKNKDEEFNNAIERFKYKFQEIFHKEFQDNEIEDMLIQHLLTERIFRNIFNNIDFRNRNPIAIEIENLVSVLTKHEFSRKTFFQSIDHFYTAIETTAKDIEDFNEKQEFLNEIYELFFFKYSYKNADKNGIVYTPQPIVLFMIHFVSKILQSEFGKKFSDENVNIIDPCVGTGNYIINILDKIELNKMEYKYKNEMFCNEIMLLPYYVASINIEYYFYEKFKRYEQFKNIVFTNSLELIEKSDEDRGLFSVFNQTNTERARNELKKDFFVIIGNPPYNASQDNANLNNPNYKSEYIDTRIKNTYSKDSKAQLRNKLFDPYVKFFRWATDRMGNNNGIICFISNNSFITDIQFDGMRKHLLKDFHRIYHLDLGGDIYTNPKLSGTVHNVFGIRVGVGITFLIKNDKYKDHKIFYHKVDEYWKKEEKYEYLISCLNKFDKIKDITTQKIFLNKKGNLIFKNINNIQKYYNYTPLFNEKDSVKGIFINKYPGISTNRNDWAYDFNKQQLKTKMQKTIDFYNGEVSRLKLYMKNHSLIDINLYDFVQYDETKIKWSNNLIDRFLKNLEYSSSFNDQEIEKSMFRPFITKYLYYNKVFIDRPSKYKKFVNFENPILIINGKGSKKISAFITNLYPNLDLLEKSQCFPLYIYNNGKKEYNISEYVVSEFQNKFEKKISKKDIFYYVYGVLNHPLYIENFGDLFLNEFPNIKISKRYFDKIKEIGKKIAELHLNYENIKEYDIDLKINKDIPFSYKFQKLRFKKNKTKIKYNDSIELINIPQDIYNYKVNGKSLIHWVIDQYKNYDEENDDVIILIKKLVTVAIKTLEYKNSLLKIKI